MGGACGSRIIRIEMELEGEGLLEVGEGEDQGPKKEGVVEAVKEGLG